MPGWWEGGGGSVLTAILTRESAASQWASGLRRLSLPPGLEPILISGRPYDDARNHAAQLAIEEKCSWLFFIDDDVVPPPDAFFKLSAHKKDIVSGLYLRRHPPVVPCMQVNYKWVTTFSFPALLEVDFVGAGCLLISTEVFKKMKRPWFEWRCDRPDLPETERLSEDFAFCRDAKQAGYKVLVDTSVQCEHWGLGKARIGNVNGQLGFEFVPGGAP